MEATTFAGKQSARPVFVADTLRGDVRDILLMHVRSMETPWSKLSEKQQSEKIEAIDKAARTVVRGAVNLVAQQGFASLDVRVSSKGKYGDGGIEMSCSAAFTSVNVTKIAEYGNGSAILVFAEPGEYFGERRAVHAEPDQHAMFRDGDPDENDAADAEGSDDPDADGGARKQSLEGVTLLAGEGSPEFRAELGDKARAAGGKVEGDEPAKPSRSKRRISESEPA